MWCFYKGRSLSHYTHLPRDLECYLLWLHTYLCLLRYLQLFVSIMHNARIQLSKSVQKLINYIIIENDAHIPNKHNLWLSLEIMFHYTLCCPILQQFSSVAASYHQRKSIAIIIIQA